MDIPESITGNRISFAVSASNYNTHQDKQKFRYRIKEVNKNWSETTTNPVFEWVPEISGDFHFEVQSINRDLNYSPPVNVPFRIKYPWYKESATAIPFWGFILLIIGFSGYSTQKYYSQRNYTLFLKEQAQKKDREVRKNLEEKNSELLESQKAAEAANEAKSTFLANMSHELRTPLNAIIGYSEMLIEDAEDENEDFIPDLDKINNSGKHLLGLINDILDLSKVESGKMELYLEEFDLEKVMNEIESTIKPLVEKNNNTMNIDYDTNVKTMKADVTKVRQILFNLLSNASKFTKEGIISIKVSDTNTIENGIDFTISDTGIGMNPEQVEKVFKPFTQADEKTTRKFGGTGLGLTITKMFTEMMGGSINIESKEGRGTTFIVTMPVHVIDKSKESLKLIDKVEKDAAYSILVIDDDDNAQDMMRKFLEKHDYTILQAKTGEDGLKLAAEHMPDAITLDVMMPEMDGWEVLAALQANEVTKNIPVIMLTMANEPDIGYSLGATDYLTKPVNWNELSNILKKHQIESDSQSVLIVEDDETTRNMLRKSLETNEYKVRSAVNGKEALEKIQSSKPGLILLDLMMPEMDGFEFAERLRENKEWLDIPVVVITAKDLTKEDHARLKGNVEAIMQKGSYSRNELLNEVSERIKKITEG
jgi:signal transduction histidine kinase/CheY-like chemotaxis protein